MPPTRSAQTLYTNAPRVISAVKSTMLTAPNRTAVPMTPLAVIRKLSFGAPVTSESAVFSEVHTCMASKARYSTAVATIATTNSTRDTANENFITDHGSIRLRCRRARRGPRFAPPVAVRVGRPVSGTRTGLCPVTGRVGVATGETYDVAPVVCRSPAPVTLVTGAFGGVTAARAMTGAALPVAPTTEAVPVTVLGATFAELAFVGLGLVPESVGPATI